MAKHGSLPRHGKHNKPEDEIAAVVHGLQRLQGVKRVLLGRREACRHRFRKGEVYLVGEVREGVRLRAYTNVGVRSIFVLVDDSGQSTVDRIADYLRSVAPPR